MRLVMRTHDNPARLALRQELMDAHLSYLADHHAEILVAGSLREDTDGDPIGALWVLEVESVTRAQALVEGDPFYLGGLRTGYELLHWSKAFSDPVEV